MDATCEDVSARSPETDRRGTGRETGRENSLGAGGENHRPMVTELRLSAFKSHRGAVFPLGPLTLFAGASGSGKSSVLQAYEALARLGGGAELGTVFPDPAGCVPERAEPDAQGRRGFRIGCTVDGPVGPVRLDLAVQAEPVLRVVGERLSCAGQTLLSTALRDPGRPTVEAAWHTAGTARVTRAPLPDDRLGTALLPLRVAGKTEGQLRVLAAAEQAVVALRSVFACDPQPQRMRRPVAVGEGRLLRGCDNLAEVLRRTRDECARRHAVLVEAARAGCAGPVRDLSVEQLADGTVRAVLGRGEPGDIGTSTPAGTPPRATGRGGAQISRAGPGAADRARGAGRGPGRRGAVGAAGSHGARGRTRPLPRPAAGGRAGVPGRGDVRPGTHPAGGGGRGRLVRPGDGRSDRGRPGAVSEPDMRSLQRRLAEFAAARRWQPYHTPKNLAVALSVEASELVEIFQWLTPEESSRVMDDPERAHRVADEVADVLAYLLQFCEVLGVDALAALSAKIDRNELRFPVPGAEEDGECHSPE
ncbi:hypothetical protein GCM10020367_49370 [Streptomyces sannanensis]|uniref:Nucleotide pyrophosphohydrolase n=2 Tax=Streptomyces sannanensis TaxID=285536 RepID=A0ABP6SIE3_9ACTN